MLDFVLGGVARYQRGQGDVPVTMLLHGSHLIIKQMEMADLVFQRFSELKDEWRYQRPARNSGKVRPKMGTGISTGNSSEPSR